MYRLDDDRTLNDVTYTYEVWDWKTKTYVADITNIIQGNVSITWALDDVEEMSFTVDLVQLEKKARLMGVKVNEILTPYVHDIRVRRNDKYIVGVQVVETTININKEVPTIDVSCTGFLNTLKGQIIDGQFGGETYAEIAQNVVQEAQRGDNLIRNGRFDIDVTGWLTANGGIYHSTGIGRGAQYGGGCLGLAPSSTGGHWVTTGIQLNCAPGVPITIEMMYNSANAVTWYVRERYAVGDSGSQRAIWQGQSKGSWGESTMKVNYTTFYNNGWLIVEYSDSNTGLGLIDNLRVYRQDDGEEINTLGINVDVGSVNRLSQLQTSGRQRNYDLQDAKEALVNLTKLSNDNFDFEFLPDRTFRVAQRLGSDKPEIEVSYPGNVESGTIERSAVDLANKVKVVGSGIGEERVEVTRSNTQSRQKYGTREVAVTSNDVQDLGILNDSAIGSLWDMKEPTNLPSFTVEDGSINPGNVQIGDSILVKIYDDDYLDSTTGLYRIVEYRLSVSEDNTESVELTFEKPATRPSVKKYRYIRESVGGNTVNAGAHWVRVKALRYNGKNNLTNIFDLNELRNGSASIKPTVTASKTIWSGSPMSLDQIIWRSNDDSNKYVGMDNGGTITIDLKRAYDLDFINVLHFYSDGRTYHNVKLSVGNSLPDGLNGTAALETVLWDTSKAGDGYASGEYMETANGRTSRYLQEEVQNEEDDE